MSWHRFRRHMQECDVDLVVDAAPVQVVIRTEHGDCDVAAVHRSTDGTTLIIDLGHPIVEVTHG